MSRMLAESAQKLGVSTLIYSEGLKDPAAQIGVDFEVGSLRDSAGLRKFLGQVKHVIFENEFLDCEQLRSAAQGTQATFFPQLKVIEKIQDKLEQKNILSQLQIPTTEYQVARRNEDLSAVLKCWPGGIVLKQSRNGYDGKGNFFLDSAKDLGAAEIFLKSSKSTVYAEKKINFKRELAMVAVRTRSGDFLSYPLVLSEQEKGICKRVMGPAHHFGVSKELEIEAAQWMKKMADDLELVGTYAIEFFETNEGQLLVNEIAPRVHNSGHYSQLFFPASQFDNHVRSIVFDKLEKPRIDSDFLMYNLIGAKGIKVSFSEENKFSELPKGCDLYWYFKAEIREGRKMGHINSFIRGTEYQKKFQEIQEWENNWIQSLMGEQ